MRNYKRKTDKGQTSPEVMLRAVKEVKLNKRSIRSIAREYQVSHRTLARYCLKFTSEQLAGDAIINFKLGYNKRQVFGDVQESILVEHLKFASSIFHGLSSKVVRRLAYEYAVHLDVTYPESWKSSHSAGPDWWGAFMKRHDSLKTTLDTDVQNKGKTGYYFSKLRDIIKTKKLKPKNIWNMDEAGIPTVQIYDGAIDKQVGRLNSHEYGRLITMTLAGSALGEFTPPYFLAPDQSIKEMFINNGPENCKVDVNVFGWMEAKHFHDFLKQLAEYAECSPENIILLMIENYEDYVSIKTLEFIKEKGIILITFPTNVDYLQPLDRVVFGPFRKKFNAIYYSVASKRDNKHIQECDLPVLVKEALISSLISENIIDGFKSCRIYPLPDL